MGEIKLVTSKIAEVLLQIFTVMAVGFYVAKIKIVKEENFKAFADLTVLVAIPALIFYGIYTNYTLDMLKTSYMIPIVGVAVPFLTYLVSKIIFLLLKVPEEIEKELYLISSFSNTLFVGLPVSLALFGEKSLPFVILYDFGHTSLFWTLGVMIITGDKLFNAKNFKKLVNPSTITLFFSFLAITLHIKIPSFLLKSLQMIGGIAVPLAMMFIGMNMVHIDFKERNGSKYVYIAAVIKLILAPLIAYGVVSFLSIPSLVKKIVILESAMPAMASSAIIAKQYDKNHKFVSISVFLTNMLSFITISVILYLMG